MLSRASSACEIGAAARRNGVMPPMILVSPAIDTARTEVCNTAMNVDKAIIMAAQFGYDRHGFEGYLGNVG